MPRRAGRSGWRTLPGHFDQRLRPALRKLLEAAVANGAVRADVDADELLTAVTSLCMSTRDGGAGRAERMVALLVDGLRYRANPPAGTLSRAAACELRRA
jgi:hypothetical protein